MAQSDLFSGVYYEVPNVSGSYETLVLTALVFVMAFAALNGLLSDLSILRERHATPDNLDDIAAANPVDAAVPEAA